MLESLALKLDNVFKKLRGKGLLTEKDVIDALKEIRLSLLEADVNYRVVKSFVESVKEKALQQEVLKNITPGEQVVKIVWEEMCGIMGKEGGTISLSSSPPTIIMLVGLQGSGKTTTTAKLANIFKKDGKKVLIVAADTNRPAAADQLEILGKSIGVDVHRESGKDPLAIAMSALAKRLYYDLLIFDTAGRLHIDEELMEQLKDMKIKLSPHETLLVADAMTGQDAVNIAESFSNNIGIDGVILTKMEGDARGGALLSIRAVTGKPVKFIGVGENVDAMEPFYPERVASKILGMGDIVSLVEKVKKNISGDSLLKLEEKIKKDSFDLEDFKEQLKQLVGMGPIEDILGMVPGGSRLLGLINSGPGYQKEINRAVSIINSMTKEERRNYVIISGNRRKRISKGSGTSVQEVNKLLKNFFQTKKMIKAFSGKKGKTALGRALSSVRF
ncbi:MAG: signal recognition particle protein [Nitrospirota bacterium]